MSNNHTSDGIANDHSDDELGGFNFDHGKADDDDGASGSGTGPDHLTHPLEIAAAQDHRAAPPGDLDWGENSKQSHPEYPDPEDPPTNWHHKHTDATDIRRKFGIPQYSDNWDEVEHPYPNCLVHTRKGTEWGHPGGTNFLAIGEKGSGKSTFALYWSVRQMEVNDETVVWRGSPNTSEWLPFRYWTTLWLPAGASVSPRWKPRDMRQQNAGIEADLSEVVREVCYYDDPRDLNNRLNPATFNVVYPDPSFSACEEIMRTSDYVPKNVSFTPAWEADEQGGGTPTVHWWYAWFVSKLEDGPYDWTSVIFDEAKDLAPSVARSEVSEQHAKVESFRKVIDQSRKFYLSMFLFSQEETEVNEKARKAVQWRVALPDEEGNPTAGNDPLGFGSVPMETNMLLRRDAGHGILWTPTNFTAFTWPDIDSPITEEWWLKIGLNRPDAYARASESPGVTQGEADGSGVANDD
jgi:hypothetical protein